MRDIALDITNCLADAVPSLGKGVNLFVGEVLPATTDGTVPTEAVFVQASGGTRPQPYMNHRGTYRRVLVDVHVRADPNSPASAESLSRLVHDALTCPAIAGLVLVLPEQSAPVYLGTDDASCPRWLVTVRVEWREP